MTFNFFIFVWDSWWPPCFPFCDYIITMFDIIWNCKNQIFTCLRPIANLYFWLKYRLYRVFFTTLPDAVGHIVNLAVKSLVSLGKSLPLCLPQNFSKGKKQIVSHNQPLFVYCFVAASLLASLAANRSPLRDSTKRERNGKGGKVLLLSFS